MVKVVSRDVAKSTGQIFYFPPIVSEIRSWTSHVTEKLEAFESITVNLRRFVKDATFYRHSLTGCAIKSLGRWLDIVCPADVPLELFEAAVSQLIHHPEHNSTLILRSETISDSDNTIPSSAPCLEGYSPVRNVHRKLLPRRPGQYSGLEQHRMLYAFGTGEFACLPSMLVLTPLVPEGESLPYYHPTVTHLAFRFIPSNLTTTSDSTFAQPALRIEVTPLPGTPTDLNNRLYRTALALLDTLHYGAVTFLREMYIAEMRRERRKVERLTGIPRPRPNPPPTQSPPLSPHAQHPPIRIAHIHALPNIFRKVEELAGHIEDLVTEVKGEQEARESLEREFEFDDTKTLHCTAPSTISHGHSPSSPGDLEAVQNSLRDMEQQSKELRETITTARFSLQLEVDRLKCDVDRLEDELSRTKKDVGDREGTTRDREDLIHKLQLEVQQLTTQLNTQTQARLGLSEKLDSTQTSLKTAEAELFGYRTRVNELETRLSKDQRTLLSAENPYGDQLTERNTLLLTIYQYMDNILGVDKTPIQLDFDKHVKKVEGKFTEKVADMRRQLDMRWKQIDKFESSVKAYEEAKATWRRKFTAKDGEIEGLKATNAELTSQLKWEARVKEYEARLKAGGEVQEGEAGCEGEGVGAGESDEVCFPLFYRFPPARKLRSCADDVLR
ncbi:hypothetical protein DEU56DRAFT_963486 [Suillus clintonianus]|uniref:uncharacterized protein n=1 Tax=Suillus clintonianus TaxID=1904413 RepID=UPI001B881F35|nr:uncharacterized protein DEU56DRAFT_963486 [Suillus clintonianus]KAG2124635.1 hypothetical protein DEU56DRAFT_963486 [Suillus clintonianus]